VVRDCIFAAAESPLSLTAGSWDAEMETLHSQSTRDPPHAPARRVLPVGPTPPYYFDDYEDPPELNPRILTTTDYDELLGPLPRRNPFLKPLNASGRISVSSSVSLSVFQVQSMQMHI
jgi:hypothetical protein